MFFRKRIVWPLHLLYTRGFPVMVIGMLFLAAMRGQNNPSPNAGIMQYNKRYYALQAANRAESMELLQSNDGEHWKRHPTAFPSFKGYTIGRVCLTPNAGSPVSSSQPEPRHDSLNVGDEWPHQHLKTETSSPKTETPTQWIATLELLPIERGLPQIGLAYSNDQGKTWQMVGKNAGDLIPNPGFKSFGSPSLHWYKPGKCWILTLAAQDRVRFYTSAALWNWAYACEFGQERGSHQGNWTQAMLLEMPVRGEADTRWVLLTNDEGVPDSTQYFVGHFDGRLFTLDTTMEKTLGRVSDYIPEGDLFDDFETDYKQWERQDGAPPAFGDKPAAGMLPGQGKVEGYLGNGLVNTFLKGDDSKGQLFSKPFIIQKPYISFLLGGGEHPSETCISLWVKDKEVRSTTGKNREKLSWTAWDVQAYAGQQARLEIRDTLAGDWAHINVDHLLFSAQPARNAYDKAAWIPGTWVTYMRNEPRHFGMPRFWSARGIKTLVLQRDKAGSPVVKSEFFRL